MRLLAQRHGLLSTALSAAVALVAAAALPAAAQAQPVSAREEVRDTSDQAEAYRLFMSARHLEGAGDLDGAIQALRDAARLDPDAGEPLAELAELYARAGRSEEGLAVAGEALEREPDNLTAHRVLGLAHASAAASREGTREDTGNAITHLEQARDTVVPDLQVELTLARLYLATSDTDNAIVLLQELMKDQLGYAPAGILLSQAYEQAGRADEALATLEATLAGSRPTYEALARLGEMYERRRRWEDAAIAYGNAAALNPRNAAVRHRLARALLAAGEPEQARTVLESLIEMRPRDAVSHLLLAEVELDLNNFDAAESLARTLIDLEPDGLRGPLTLADVFDRRREHQRVVDVLTPVLERARESGMRPERLAQLFDRLGLAHAQLEDMAAAAGIYEEAVRMMPSSLPFQARLAQAYVDGERHDAAARVLRRARMENPGNLTLAIIEAGLLGRRGQIDRGEDLLREALSVDGDNPRAHVALGAFYSEHDRLDDAIAVLESARRRFPDETNVLFQLGAVLERNDRFSDAEQAFRRVIDQDPEHAQALNYLGYMLAERGERLDESVRLIERAIERDPHNGSYLDSLGWAYFKLDRLDLAEPPLRAASDQLQRNSVVQDHMGDLLNRLGRYAEAIEAWERALNGDGEEIDPDEIERKITGARQRLGR